MEVVVDGVSVAWRTTWRPKSPLDFPAILDDFLLMERAHKQDARNGRPITSVEVLTSGTVRFMVFRSGKLQYWEMRSAGNIRERCEVTINRISHTSHYEHEPRTKVWQRHRTPERGYAWKCTYNEHPASPKHILSGMIPMDGYQLVAELTSLASRQQRGTDPMRDALLVALEETPPGLHWRRNLSTPATEAVQQIYPELIAVFSGRVAIHDDVYTQVLKVLDEHIRLPPEKQEQSVSLFAHVEQRRTYELARTCRTPT